MDLGWAGLLRPAPWRTALRIVLGEMTPLALPLAALGLAGRPRTGAASLHVRIAVLSVVLAGLAFGLRYSTTDPEVFLLPCTAGLAVAAGLGVSALARAGSRKLRAGSAVLAAVAVLVPATLHFPARSLRGDTAAADYGRDILQAVPQDGALFVESDEAFVLLYLVAVLGERSDVALHDRNGRYLHDLAEEIALDPRPGEGWMELRVRRELAFIARELGRMPPRAVCFRGWPGYELPAGHRLEPHGLVHRALPGFAPLLDDATAWRGSHEESVRDHARRSGTAFAEAAAASYAVARGERAMFLGDTTGAQAGLEQASRLGSRDASLQSYIGTVYGRAGDYPRAIAMFRRAVEVDPAHLRAWANLVTACDLAGDADGARRAREALGRLTR
jgi:tetratricopeptide (TPR) repeat protein